MLNDGIKKGQINKQVDWKGVWQEGYGCLTANGICPLEISPRCIFNLPLIKLQDWWIFCMTWSQLVKSPQVKPTSSSSNSSTLISSHPSVRLIFSFLRHFLSLLIYIYFFLFEKNSFTLSTCSVWGKVLVKNTETGPPLGTAEIQSLVRGY